MDIDLTFVLVPLAAVIAPLLAALIKRALVVPLIVFEIGLGMLMGPSGLGWVPDSDTLEVFSWVGLAMLFFMAGSEIDLRAVHGANGARAFGGWAVSAVLAMVAGLLLGGSLLAAVIIAIALTSTALGTITPILRDAGLTSGRLGVAISGAGAVGEFLPLVAITVFLSGQKPLAGLITLVIFISFAAVAFVVSARAPKPGLQRMVISTLHTSGQFGVRLVMALLAGLVAMAMVLDVDFLLGAFTAGLLGRTVLRALPAEQRRIVDMKLEAVAFGFFVPLFFVTTGVGFPLRDLLADGAALALVPLFAGVILLVRGVPAFLLQPRGTPVRDRRTVALFTATTLPIVIAVTAIGVDSGALDASIAAALTGGAMLSVLLFPMLALAGRSRSATEPPAVSRGATRARI